MEKCERVCLSVMRQPARTQELTDISLQFYILAIPLSPPAPVHSPRADRWTVSAAQVQEQGCLALWQLTDDPSARMEFLRGDGLALLEACEGAFPAHSRAHVAALSLRSKLEGPLEEGLAARNAIGAAVRSTPAPLN
jgi:hypothetical protein